MLWKTAGSDLQTRTTIVTDTGIGRYQPHALGHRLCDQYPVERITVQLRQGAPEQSENP